MDCLRGFRYKSPMASCPQCQTMRGQWDEVCTKCSFSYKELDAQKAAAGAAAAAIAVGCPSCGAPRKDGDVSCLGCGVVYSKWKPREARPAAPGAAAYTGPQLGDKNMHKERPGCLTFMMIATILVNGAAAVFLPALKLPGVAAGPLIAVCVATSVCAVFVLQWKRWAVYGIAVVQILSIGSILLSGNLLALIQPALVLALFYYFVSPIRYHFD